MEGAEPLPRRSGIVFPKLTTALPLITKRAQHPKITQKRLFRQIELPQRGSLLGGAFLLSCSVNNTIFQALNVYFAALKAATKGSPWMGPSFTWMDQDPRGPWTRCLTRPCLPLPTHETVRQANGLRNVDWTFGKCVLL